MGNPKGTAASAGTSTERTEKTCVGKDPEE